MIRYFIVSTEKLLRKLMKYKFVVSKIPKLKDYLQSLKSIEKENLRELLSVILLDVSETLIKTPFIKHSKTKKQFSTKYYTDCHGNLPLFDLIISYLDNSIQWDILEEINV